MVVGSVLDVRRGRRYENFFGIPVPIIPWACCIKRQRQRRWWPIWSALDIILQFFWAYILLLSILYIILYIVFPVLFIHCWDCAQRRHGKCIIARGAQKVKVYLLYCVYQVNNLLYSLCSMWNMHLFWKKESRSCNKLNEGNLCLL